MIPTKKTKILDEAESLLGSQVRQVELLGEIPIGEERIADLCRAISKLGLKDVRKRWPHCFAVCLVGIARYWYSGHNLWGRAEEAFGITLSGPDAAELGRWFEDYLALNHLPGFRHLVDEGALRYLTPILAHAVVPRALVSDFMESVVWPSVEDPDGAGATGEDIQQRMSRHVPNMPRSLQRFVIHGGQVARDVIDRSIVVAVTTTSDRDVDPGLPDWLREAITAWVEERPLAQSTQAITQRGRARRFPVLRFDPVYARVQLELPYVDEREAAWEVHLPSGQLHREEWKPAWQRTSAGATIAIDRPFATLNVALKTPAGILGLRTFDGLTTTRPCLFFDCGSGRAMGASGFLTNSKWYVIAPTGSAFFADGQPLLPRESLGEPLGTWPGLVAEYYEAPNTKEVRVEAGGSNCQYRLVEELPGARLEAPVLQSSLAAISTGVLAFESDLPTIVLPAPPEGGDETEYLTLWSVRLTSDSGSSDERRPASALSPEQLVDGSYRLHLEDLVPGPDVGDWNLEVTGPLGRGFTTRLSLLPEMTFEVLPEGAGMGIAGPELGLASVLVRTRDGIRVLEEEDSAAPAEGGWMLQDRNHNGRIPFTVRDSGTERETSALIRLETVQWRWLVAGALACAQNAAERFSLDAIEPGASIRLLASNPGDASLHLRLVDGAGALVQEELQQPSTGRGASFELGRFLTSAMEALSPSLRLRLELVTGEGQSLGGTVVAQLTRDIEPHDVRVEELGPVTAVDWKLPRSFPGAVARIASLSRPWEPPVKDAEAFEDPEGGRARVEVDSLLPGRYELRIWYDDGWVGLAPLGPAVEFEVGTAESLAQHIATLPPTASGRLEGMLLRSDPDGRRQMLNEFASGIGPHQLAEIVDCVAGALAQDRAGELLSLPWAEVAAVLAAVEGDPLPLLTSIAVHAGAQRMPGFCAAIGLDRWPALLTAEIPPSLLPGLWAAWMPLGAFADLTSARTDTGAADRCEDGLGWAPGEVLVCQTCGGSIDFEVSCASCGSDEVSHRPRELPESGKFKGREFQPTLFLVEALKSHLLPVPCPPFGNDGWIGASLSALESLCRADLGTIEVERDDRIARYRQHLASYEGKVTGLVHDSGLEGRRENPTEPPWHEKYPWAFACRMSLAVALLRRLMARGRISPPSDATAAIDHLAAWLELRIPSVYERDLCFAEIACCQEFEWK